MEINKTLEAQEQDEVLNFSNEKIDNSCLDQQDEISRLAFIGANEV